MKSCVPKAWIWKFSLGIHVILGQPKPPQVTTNMAHKSHKWRTSGVFLGFSPYFANGLLSANKAWQIDEKRPKHVLRPSRTRLLCGTFARAFLPKPYPASSRGAFQTIRPQLLAPSALRLSCVPVFGDTFRPHFEGRFPYPKRVTKLSLQTIALQGFCVPVLGSFSDPRFGYRRGSHGRAFGCGLAAQSLPAQR